MVCFSSLRKSIIVQMTLLAKKYNRITHVGSEVTASEGKALERYAFSQEKSLDRLGMPSD